MKGKNGHILDGFWLGSIFALLVNWSLNTNHIVFARSETELQPGNILEARYTADYKMKYGYSHEPTYSFEEIVGIAVRNGLMRQDDFMKGCMEAVKPILTEVQRSHYYSGCIHGSRIENPVCAPWAELCSGDINSSCVEEQ